MISRASLRGIVQDLARRSLAHRCHLHNQSLGNPIMYMQKTRILSVLLLAIAANCVSMRPALINQEDLLENSEEMKIQGTRGWGSHRTVRFGQYYTGKFDLGTTHPHKYNPSILTNSAVDYFRSTNTFSFPLFNSLHDSIVVTCHSSHEEKHTHITDSLTDTKVLVDIYRISLHHRDVEIDMLIESNSIPPVSIFNDELVICKDFKYDSKKKIAFLGYLFKLNNDTIAALDCHANGTIWFHDRLPERTRLILGAIAIGILLRPEMRIVSFGEF